MRCSKCKSGCNRIQVATLPMIAFNQILAVGVKIVRRVEIVGWCILVNARQPSNHPHIATHRFLEELLGRDRRAVGERLTGCSATGKQIVEETAGTLFGIGAILLPSTRICGKCMCPSMNPGIISRSLRWVIAISGWGADVENVDVCCLEVHIPKHTNKDRQDKIRDGSHLLINKHARVWNKTSKS